VKLMAWWALLALAFLIYNMTHGPSVPACVGLFFCGCNFALQDLKRVQAPMFERMRQLLEGKGRKSDV
jgi:hypothetical protein